MHNETNDTYAFTESWSQKLYELSSATYEHNGSANSSDGKHKGCCDGKARGVLRWKTQGVLQSTGKVGRTENTTELVKPQQANEGLSLSAEACVPLSSEMKTPPVPARQRT